MINLIDIHTHTVACGHAYSTWEENIVMAVKQGLKYYGVCEHAPQTQGSVGHSYFFNLRVIPSEMDGTRILKGVELNILNEAGDVDLDDNDIAQLDFAYAALHISNFPPQTREINTNAYLNVMKNPHIKVIAHPDDGRYLIDCERFVKAAKDNHVAIEVNNSSLMPSAYRQNAHENIKEVLHYCEIYEVPVIMGSDAHISYDIGNITHSKEVLESINFPNELIINYHEHLIEEYILKPRSG